MSSGNFEIFQMTRTRFRLSCFLLLAALALTSCLPAATLAISTPTATASPTETLSPLPPTVTPTPLPAARRVLILSLDGMRPDAIAQAPMPKLTTLMQNGAYSLTAQTIYPSGTLMAHASMLTGLCPDKHGVNWDYYDPDLGYAKGPGLFDLAHAAGMKTVMVVGKKMLRQVILPESTDIYTYINDRGLVIAQHVADEVIPQGFGVLFIHFPTPDWMGHEHGWMSWQYLDVLRQDDQALGILLSALDNAGLRNDTLVIVTADHGGHDHTNGSNLPEDMTIPWIISGPGVRPMTITSPVSTTDTAATAAWALGLSIPPEWDGIPIYEVFELPYQTRPDPRCSY
jgi:predicted AlkP superfamily pyrophosphatase or phosphodiesterase